ncbi:protein of unknown function (plasmid) [Caballeronia sp. S22]
MSLGQIHADTTAIGSPHRFGPRVCAPRETSVQKALSNICIPNEYALIRFMSSLAVEQRKSSMKGIAPSKYDAMTQFRLSL